MPINPIKEERKILKKYNIGCYSTNNKFFEKLENTLTSSGMQFELTNLNDLDNEILNLYLSVSDEIIFENEIPENISEILENLKLFYRVISLKDIEKSISQIQDRSKLILELKKEKTFDREKDLKFIMQIVNILENKDPYTKDHSARVAKYSLAIGEEFFSSQYDELYGNTEN